MALDKATIINENTGEQFVVNFNPEEYVLSNGNQIAEIPIPGAARPPLQYVRGQASTLSMDLFFDSYEAGSDVRVLTSQIVSLIDEDPRRGAPPVLLFAWGGFAFRCLLESVTQRFTMFLEDGRPVRATLQVAFKEYEEAQVEIEHGLFVGPPTIRNVIAGDTASGVAGAVLGDPEAWRVIAEANGIDDPFDLATGSAIIVPSGGAGSGGGGS